MEPEFGYVTRTRGGVEFRCYYETVPSDAVNDLEERARVQALERDGYRTAMFYVAGEDPVLGGVAKGHGTLLTQEEFVKARDTGWPDGPAATRTVSLGGSLDVEHRPAKP
jgi:hypothetical protein